MFSTLEEKKKNCTISETLKLLHGNVFNFDMGKILSVDKELIL